MTWAREPEDDYGAGEVVDYVPAEETHGARSVLEARRRYESEPGNDKPRPKPEPDQTLDDFLNEPEPDYDWLIPGVLERGDRLILTGPEGGGKSTYMRQIGVQSSSGIHPFNGDQMTPIRVLMVDLENSKGQVKRKLRAMRLAAGADFKNELSSVRVHTQGLNLMTEDDRNWLEDRLIANRPDLLLIGPLYKLVGGDPNEEKVAKPAAIFLDRMRAAYQFAVIIEAHTGHAQGGGRRPERPYGASIWMRWPEFGIYLSPEGNLRHWRGARDEREWPAALKRGGAWPWSPVTDKRGATFGRILEVVRDAGETLSFHEIGRRVDTHPEQVKRAVAANQAQYDELLRKIQLGEEF